MKTEARLKELGIDLPAPTAPLANYVNAVRTGNLLFLAGKGPGLPGKPLPVGKVGRDMDVATAKQHARSTGISLIAAMKAELGDLDRVKRIVNSGAPAIRPPPLAWVTSPRSCMPLGMALSPSLSGAVVVMTTTVPGSAVFVETVRSSAPITIVPAGIVAFRSLSPAFTIAAPAMPTPATAAAPTSRRLRGEMRLQLLDGVMSTTPCDWVHPADDATAS